MLTLNLNNNAKNISLKGGKYKAKIKKINLIEIKNNLVVGKCPLCDGEIIKWQTKKGLNYFCTNFKKLECKIKFYPKMKTEENENINITDNKLKKLLLGECIEANNNFYKLKIEKNFIKIEKQAK